MLHYFLEFEESIGKNWDKYLRRKVNKFHEESRIYFSDISKTLNIFHHLLGGEKGKDLQITDKRYVDTKRTLLQKISFSGKEFYLTWQDEKSIYLPASFAYFPTKEQNEMLYYWLVAMATKVDIDDNNIIEQNSTAIKYLKNRYTGFDNFYKDAVEYLCNQFEHLSFIKSFDQKNNEDLINNYPNPFWIYPPLSSNNTLKNDKYEEEEKQEQRDNEKNDTLEMKKQANQSDDKDETDGFLAFLPESLMSIFEKVNVDRIEDDTKCVLGIGECDGNNKCALHDQWIEPRNLIRKMYKDTTLDKLEGQEFKM